MKRRGFLSLLALSGCADGTDMRGKVIVGAAGAAAMPMVSGALVGGVEFVPPTPATILNGQTYQWVEAGLGETLTADTSTGGGNYIVDAVADQSPGGYNYSQTTSARPRLEVGGWNGSSAWVFDGTADRLVSTGTSIASVAGSGSDVTHTIWIAAQTFLTSQMALYSLGNSASSSNFEELLQNPSWTVRKNSGSNFDAVGGVSQQTYNWFRLETDGAGTSLTIVRNGVDETTVPGFNAGSVTYDVNALACLRRSTFTAFLNGRIKAYVHMAGVPTAQQRTDMDAYFANMIVPRTPPMLVMTGDSHTHTAVGESSWMEQIAAAMPTATFVNNGVPGDTLVGMLAEPGFLARYSHSIYDSNRSVVAYGNHYGANDIEGAFSRTATELKADIQTWAAAVEAAHPGVPKIGCTLHKIPSLPAGKETERVNHNADIRANPASFGLDYVLDKDLLIPEAATDPLVYEISDKHLNAVGEARLVNGHLGVPGMLSILTSIGF